MSNPTKPVDPDTLVVASLIFGGTGLALLIANAGWLMAVGVLSVTCAGNLARAFFATNKGEA